MEKLAKIYILRSKQTDDVYYGCTTRKLNDRLTNHKYVFKKQSHYITSFEIVKYDDAYIELVEEFEYKTRKDCDDKEAFYIRNNLCVNKIIPGRTDKEYRPEQKEEIKEIRKKYRDEHKEEIKKYFESRKEQKKEYDKKYRIVNKEKRKKYCEENREKKRECDKKYREAKKYKE